MRIGAADAVDFNKEIKPILELHCVKCHGVEKPKGKLSLTTREAALKVNQNEASSRMSRPAFVIAVVAKAASNGTSTV